MSALEVVDGWDDPIAEVDLDELRRRRDARWIDCPDDVIPMFVADGDGPVCPPVRAAIDELLERGELTYFSDRQAAEVAAAFSDRMADRYGWQPDPSLVRIFSDVGQPAALALDRLTSPGDAVMMHVPGYPPFLRELDATGRRLAPLPFERVDDNWSAPIADVESAADAGARVLFLVNPQNPLGVVWDRAALQALAEVVVERDLVVVADEIYAELTHDPHEHVPFASLGPEVEARTVTLTSAAKSHNIAGVRCSVAHIGERVGVLRDITSAQLGEVSNIGLVATLAAWREADGWLEAYRAALTERRDRVAAGLAAHLPAVEHVPAEGGFAAWFDVRPLELPQPPAEFFLERARVALDPGEPYGAGGEGRLRACYATAPLVVDEVIERMVTAVDIWQAAR